MIFNIFRSKKAKSEFTKDEATKIANKLSIDFDKEKFSLKDFHNGMNVELEHGRVCAKTNTTNDNPTITGKIALAHLNEFPDYYERLKKLEIEGDDYWKGKNKKRNK